MKRTNVMSGPDRGANLVVVRGVLARPIEEHQLATGSRIASFDLTVPPSEGRRTETVPVVWIDPPTSAVEHREGGEVIVIGRVRRRFFRAGAQTMSRTEVVADTVTSTRSARRVAEAMRRAAEQLGRVV